MYLSTLEARLTLEALDKLIAATECRGGHSRTQREALALQRRRRDELSVLLATRREQLGNKIVSLTLWRDGPEEMLPASPRARRSRRRTDASGEKRVR